jgi:hypothetical protein
MALQTVVVCDVCGKPASQTVGLRIGGRSLTKDVCEGHLSELTAGARQAQRGRPRVRPVEASRSRAARKVASPRRKATTSSPRRRSKSGTASQPAS